MRAYSLNKHEKSNLQFEANQTLKRPCRARDSSSAPTGASQLARQVERHLRYTCTGWNMTGELRALTPWETKEMLIALGSREVWEQLTHKKNRSYD